MGRSKKFMYNSITTALLQVVTMVAGFVTPRFMLTAYGSEINGLVSSILQFISYFNLVEAGLSSAAVYSLYKPIADKDHDKINRIVTAAKHFYIESGYIFVGLVALLAFMLSVYCQFNSIRSNKYFCACSCIRCQWFFRVFYLSKVQSITYSRSKNICDFSGIYSIYYFKYNYCCGFIYNAY